MKKAINSIKELCLTNPTLGNNYQNYYTYFKNYWGALNIKEGNFDVVEQRVRVLKEHSADFKWLYNKLGDHRSKKVLFGILYNWLYFEYDILPKITEGNFEDYFDLDLIQCDENEVLVDLGAFTGDSAKAFIDSYGKYKRIYCYDVTESSIEKCREALSGYDNIIIRNKGVGSKKGIMYVKPFGSSGSSNTISNEGTIPVEIVTIDEDIDEPITLIKMDIEGAEQEAIRGCQRHIVTEHPKLAICTYHNNEDIWKVPKMIYELNPDYKFYMRYNGKQIGPTEYVFFAL